MRYKLLVLDIDGTLTNSQKEISPATLDTLIEAQKRGLKIVLASGRPTYGIIPIAEQLLMPQFGGFILSFNGGSIIDVPTRKAIYESVVPQNLIPSLYEIAKEGGADIISYKDEYIISENPDNKYVQHELFLTKMCPQKVDSFVEAINFTPDKCLIVGEPESLLPLEAKIVDLYGDQVNAYRSEPFFLEVVPKGIDKAQSLQRLLDYIGGSREEMVAMGDGFNDLSMIKFAGVGVAMANAQEPVKEIADYITLSNDEDGVAYYVEKFIF